MMPMSYRMVASLAESSTANYISSTPGKGHRSTEKSAPGVRGLKLIAVTHLHADHCLGIPGTIMLRAQMDNPDPLTILGPPGTCAIISQISEKPPIPGQLPDQYHRMGFRQFGFGIPGRPGQHRMSTSQAYPLLPGIQVRRAGQAGKIRPRRARALGVPKGPLWGKLQKGESVNTPEKTVQPSEVPGPARRGGHIAFAVDTRPSPGVYSLCRKAEPGFPGRHVSHRALRTAM